MKQPLIYQLMDDDDLLMISNAITEAEKTTSGEIRVSIREKKPFLKRKKSIHELAEEEFFRLGMDKTRDKTGILIYLLLSEKEFHILADTGINEKVEKNTWHKIKDDMQQKFRNGFFSDGIVLGIREVGEILSSHFPIKPDDTNELPNTVSFR
ncbi:MAG TPA: TPM domain-containing protein [Ignavibacteriales bacterium]|nr:TPM domain-containing protein [Ignavibacteriales bacterium]